MCKWNVTRDVDLDDEVEFFVPFKITHEGAVISPVEAPFFESVVVNGDGAVEYAPEDWEIIAPRRHGPVMAPSEVLGNGWWLPGPGVYVCEEALCFAEPKDEPYFDDDVIGWCLLRLKED